MTRLTQIIKELREQKPREWWMLGHDVIKNSCIAYLTKPNKHTIEYHIKAEEVIKPTREELLEVISLLNYQLINYIAIFKRMGTGYEQSGEAALTKAESILRGGK